jgi:hypothetical protein
MSALITDLHKALVAELGTLLDPVPVQRRYMPLKHPKQLQEPCISVYLAARESDVVARSISTKEITFGVAIQKAVADQTASIDGNGELILDGIDNLEDGDSVLELVEQVVDLWGCDPEDEVAHPTQGKLREKSLAGCTFKELTNDPPYEPLHLLQAGVYSSIIDVTYSHGG